MGPYRDSRDSQTGTALAKMAIDAMIGEATQNMCRVRGALEVIISRIEPKPIAIGEGQTGNPKEPSLMEIARTSLELSALCVKMATELEGMMFQGSRSGSTQMVA